MLGSLRLMAIVAAVLLTRQAAQGQVGTVASHQKISDTDGDFTGILDNLDQFIGSFASSPPSTSTGPWCGARNGAGMPSPCTWP